MKKLSLWLLASVFVLSACNEDDVTIKIEKVASFENLITTPETDLIATEGEVISEWSSKTTYKDNQGLIEFDHYFSEWGFGGGMLCTNKTDITTPGYLNNSAITAGSKSGNVYITANGGEFSPAIIRNLQADSYEFKGAYITNTTYAYLAVKEGNDGYLNQTKFNAGDWFKLEAVGYTATGTEIGRVEMYLADYRNGKTEVLNTWKWFDWSAIARAAYIDFVLTSSDTGEYGMNTPAYFSMDDVTLIEK